MNEKQVMKLADKSCLSYFPGWVSSDPELLAFANACCDYQRESDAKICEAREQDEPAPMSSVCWQLAEVIRANKGE